MNIKTLVDEDFDIPSIAFHNPRVRYGARGIVLNEDSKVAILHKRFKNEYKLVGGGVLPGETYEQAFLREVQEETGCEVQIDSFLGTIKEFKSQDNFQQISYVYIAHVIDNTFKTHFTEQEQGEGAELLWLDVTEALKRIKDSEIQLVPSDYEGELSVYHSKFVVRRDFEILKFYCQQTSDIKNNYSRL